MFETINLWIQDHQELVYSLIFTYCVSKASILPVFVGIFVVSESLLLGPSMVAMVSGAVAGDMLRFWLGRKYGDVIVRKLPESFSKWLGKTMRLFDHYGVAYILLCRYHHPLDQCVSGRHEFHVIHAVPATEHCIDPDLDRVVLCPWLCLGRGHVGTA